MKNIRFSPETKSKNQNLRYKKYTNKKKPFQYANVGQYNYYDRAEMKWCSEKIKTFRNTEIWDPN